MNNNPDKKVKNIVKQLKDLGFNVHLNSPGQEKLAEIGNHNKIPDVLTNKGKQKKFIKVETPDTINKSQISTFLRSAVQSKDTSFEHEIIPKVKKDSSKK